MIQGNRGWGSLVVVCFMVLLCVGCGKKADPRYPHYSYPEKVSDLTVAIDEGKALLEWSIPGRWDRAGKARILRSALEEGSKDCPNCPRIYAIVEYLPLREARSKEEGRFRYVDTKIRRGFSYSYRVVICASSDICGEESNTAEIVAP